MPKFRKNPVVIEAHQLTKKNWKELEQWCNGQFIGNRIGPGEDDLDCIGLNIHTLEGDHLALIGDWIICGLQGEYYPCKPDIFSETYEEVSD